MASGSSRGLRPPKSSLERWVVGLLGATVHGLAFRLVLLQDYFLWVLAPLVGLVGLGAFVWSLRGSSSRKGLALGFLGWAAAAAGGLYWMSVVSWLGYGLLVLYFALFGAIFGMVAVLLRAGSGSRSWTLLVPALWTAMEYARARLFTGFPWMLSGSLFADVPWATGVADLGGVYLVSFACVLLACVLVCRKPARLVLRLAAVLGIVGACLGYGAFRSLTAASESQVLRVAAIQPVIPFKVGPRKNVKRQLREQLAQSARIAPGEVDLIIWSETMVPGELLGQVETVLAPLAREKKSHILAGGVLRPAGKSGKATGKAYNSAVLVSPAGKVIGRYDKRHLVPFGEYVPMQGKLPGTQRIFKLIGTVFTPGAERQKLPEVGTVPLGVSICFEDIFPHIARDDADRGARVLVNLTNDSWFGRTTSEARQHLALSSLRAVETRRPLVRATNTGISALIARDGTITVPCCGGLWEKGVVRMNVPVAPTSSTGYLIAGDLFAWLCALGTVIGLVAGLIRRKLGPPPGPLPAPSSGSAAAEAGEEQLRQTPADAPDPEEYMPPPPPPLELPPEDEPGEQELQAQFLPETPEEEQGPPEEEQPREPQA